MNWKALFFISISLWLGTFVLTYCTQRPGQPTTDPIDAISWGSPIICSGEGNDTCTTIRRQINAYRTLMEFSVINEIEYLNTFPPPPYGSSIDSLLDIEGLTNDLQNEMSTLRGFKYSLNDLKAIVCYADPEFCPTMNPSTSEQDSVYLMLAINTDPGSVHFRDSINSPIKYLDMYFQVRKNGTTALFAHGKRQIGESIEDMYDNFPRPCPDSCPGTE